MNVGQYLLAGKHPAYFMAMIYKGSLMPYLGSKFEVSSLSGLPSNTILPSFIRIILSTGRWSTSSRRCSMMITVFFCSRWILWISSMACIPPRDQGRLRARQRAKVHIIMEYPCQGYLCWPPIAHKEDDEGNPSSQLFRLPFAPWVSFHPGHALVFGQRLYPRRRLRQQIGHRIPTGDYAKMLAVLVSLPAILHEPVLPSYEKDLTR